MTAIALERTTEAHRAALERLFRRISEVSSLPQVAQRLAQVADDDETTAGELREIIQSDVSLTTRILRRVNSAYYGLRNPCGDLNVAINLLGFREIRNLALTVFVSRMYQQKGNHRRYTRAGLWNHVVGVGAVARMIAQLCGRASPGEAFVAGQMHDIGLILLDQNLRKHFTQVLDRLTEQTPTFLVERSLFTFDHAELGGHACQQWNFPQNIVAAVRWHHDPDGYTGPDRDLVAIVALANQLCSEAGHTSLGVKNLAPLPGHLCSSLGLDRQALAEIAAKVGPTLEKAGMIADA